MSVRFDSDVARQPGNAALAAATAASDLLDRGEVDLAARPGRSPDRRPGLRARTCRRPLAADPVGDAASARRVRTMRHSATWVMIGSPRSWCSADTILRRPPPAGRGAALRTPAARRIGPGRRAWDRGGARPARANHDKGEDGERAEPDHDRQHAGHPERADDRGIPPGRRDACPEEGPPGDRDQQQPAVRPRCGDGRHDDQREGPAQGRDPFERLAGHRRQGRGERAPRTRPQEGGRPDIDRRHALAAPTEDHRELAGPDGDEKRDRGQVRPAPDRGAQQRDDVGAGQHATDDAGGEVEPAERRVERSPGVAPERIPVVDGVTQPADHDGARDRPDDDEQQVVGAQPGPPRPCAGHDEARRDDGGERERLPADDEVVGQADQGVEVERDDGDRHGPGSVPKAGVSACRHLTCRLVRRQPVPCTTPCESSGGLRGGAPPLGGRSIGLGASRSWSRRPAHGGTGRTPRRREGARSCRTASPFRHPCASRCLAGSRS